MERKWELTKASEFLVRPLGLMKPNEMMNEHCTLRDKLGFQNAYIADKEHINALHCPVYLLFKPEFPHLFNTFLSKEYEIGLLQEDYDYPGGYVVCLYEFPKEFREDYKLILEGKYSKVSTRFKKVFPEMGTNGQMTLQYAVLYKDPKLREFREKSLDVVLDPESELWSVMDEEKETLDINKINKVSNEPV